MLGENDGKEKSYSDTQDNDKKSRLHQHQLDHFFVCLFTFIIYLNTNKK